MPNKKISQFTTVGSINSDDVFLINQTGTTNTVTMNTVSAAINTIISDKFIQKPAIVSGGELLIYNGSTATWVASAIMGASLLSTNGYTTLPNGIIMQWGRFSTGMLGSTINVDLTFPKAFPNACFSFVASIGVAIGDYDFIAQYRTDKQSVSYGYPTKTGVEGQAFIDNNIGDDRVIQWYAIGI